MEPHAMARRKPHALAIPLPFQGHIHPLLEFSKMLISAGFMVTFANIEANHQKIQSSHNVNKKKTENRDGVHGQDLRMVSLEEGFREEELLNAATLIAATLSPATEASVERLLTQLQSEEPPVTLLVCDFRLLFVHDVAKKAGISSVSFWTQSAASFICNLFVAQGWFHPPPDDLTPITCIPGMPPFTRSEIGGLALEKIPPPFPSDEYGWAPFRHVDKPTWIVLNTFEDLEATTLQTLQDRLGFRPLTLGPLVNAPSFSISKGITVTSVVNASPQWLHDLPPASVLYISFGTIVVLSEQQLEELVLGIEDSGQRILWVFRPDLCSTPGKYTVETLSRRLKKQGLVVPWAPQWQILRHPSVGGFLTHCGWNSTLEGITAGIPMLGWPGFVDQFLNQRCLEHQWGIGLGFEGGEGKDGLAALGLDIDDGRKHSGLVSRAEVTKKVRDLMEGERGRKMREKASVLGERARRALESGGSSERGFSEFLDGYGRLRNGKQKKKLLLGTESM